MSELELMGQGIQTLVTLMQTILQRQQESEASAREKLMSPASGYNQIDGINTVVRTENPKAPPSHSGPILTLSEGSLPARWTEETPRHVNFDYPEQGLRRSARLSNKAKMQYAQTSTRIHGAEGSDPRNPPGERSYYPLSIKPTEAFSQQDVGPLGGPGRDITNM